MSDLVAVGTAPLASGRNLLAELKSDPGKVSLETLVLKEHYERVIGNGGR